MSAKRAKKAARKASAKGSRGGDNFFERLITKKAAKPADKKNCRFKRCAKKTPRYNDTYEKGLVFVGMSFKGDGGNEIFNVIKESCKSIKLKARPNVGGDDQSEPRVVKASAYRVETKKPRTCRVQH